MRRPGRRVGRREGGAAWRRILRAVEELLRSEPTEDERVMSKPLPIHNNMPVTEPNAADGSLWRYMDFAKLLDILITRKLFLTRLETFDDPLEGRSSRSLLNAIPPALDAALASGAQPAPSVSEETLQEGMKDLAGC